MQSTQWRVNTVKICRMCLLCVYTIIYVDVDVKIEIRNVCGCAMWCHLNVVGGVRYAVCGGRIHFSFIIPLLMMCDTNAHAAHAAQKVFICIRFSVLFSLFSKWKRKCDKGWRECSKRAQNHCKRGVCHFIFEIKYAIRTQTCVIRSLETFNARFLLIKAKDATEWEAVSE